MKFFNNVSDRRRKGLIIVFVLLLIVLVYMLTWAIYFNVKYNPYIEAIPYNDEMQENYYIDEDKYAYSAFKPKPYFLSFKGNLAITRCIAFDTKGNRVGPNGERPYIDTDMDMLIWPKFDGSYEICLSIIEYDGTQNDEGEANSTVYQFMLNEKKEPIEVFTPEEQAAYDANQENINYIYQKMYDMWGIS